ncbi:MAG: thiamine-phosphate kinase [Hyphomicrobiaceae bacterium]
MQRPRDRIEGEAGIVALLRPLAAAFSGALGLCDDCAELAPAPGQDLVLKCDPVREGLHFLSDDDPADIAWKALAANVSDLAAKSARPVAYLLALSFPEHPARDWLERFAAGLASAQEAFGITLAGGDTDRAPGPLSITVTVIGEVPAGRMVRRAAAERGDVLFVSGTLGDAALGLKLRRDGGLAASAVLDESEAVYLIGRYLRPVPRLGLKAALRNHARAAMDVSDGLAKDLGRMLTASAGSAGRRMGATVRAADVPLSDPFRRARAAGLASLEDAVAHGDDYEVLAAVPAAAAADFAASAAAGGVPVTAIGAIEDREGLRIVDTAGFEVALSRRGWDHF